MTAPALEASLKVVVDGPGSVSVEGRARYHVPAAPSRTLILDAPDYDEVTVTGPSGVAGRYDGERITINYGQMPPELPDVTFTIEYTTRPAKGVVVSERGVWTAFSTWHWLPVKKDPSWRVRAQLHVQGPQGWTTLATGDGPERPGPDIASHLPHPAYTLGFVSGQLASEVRRGPHSVWGLPPDQAQHVLELTEQAHARLKARFGDVWALPHGYVQVFVPGRAMQELAGMAFLSGKYIDTIVKDPKEDWLIVHELAHQLWGNLVTCKTWGDFWLNEAVVTWWVGHDKGLRGDEAGHQRELALWQKRTARTLTRGGDVRIHRPGVSEAEAGGSIVYNAGATLIERIAVMMGHEAFERRLAAWMRAGLTEGVSLGTSDFIESLELEGHRETEVLRMLKDAHTLQ
ncbi:MAG: M1 family metallopeptidase [Bradymonadia bacterium]